MLALQLKGRFTDDAPLSGYSSVSLPGYTMGNYLSRHYSHVLLEGRFPLTGKLGLIAFGGVGCQFGEDITGKSLSCSDATYPSLGVGVSYMLKEEASVLIRLEIAKGKSDNEALYFTIWSSLLSALPWRGRESHGRIEEHDVVSALNRLKILW